MSEAKRLIAATQGFKLKNSAVKIKEVSAAGTTPVSVLAEVTEAFRFAQVEDESAPQTTGVFKRKHWRAVEFRTGDRSWEEFDLLAAPLGAERLEAARRALEELATEFEARQSAAMEKDDGQVEAKPDGDVKDGGKGKDKDKNKGESKVKSGEPLTRGPLTIRQLDVLVSSAVAEIVVEATFRLAKDASGKWRVAEVSVGDGSGEDPSALWRSADAQKAVRARADLEAVRAALEAFRRERGFYVVAADSAVLMDHLSPRYIKQIIRLDPWHNPYRYAGTTEGYTLASDGADGKPGTADDVTLSR
ncbi:MAG TPA: type II secretion system protein GspG [Pyrinomonadaceae bacterium]|nr:type II secretion system protein GspG [Pyrinomonadaceae bacterium]